MLIIIFFLFLKVENFLKDFVRSVADLIGEEDEDVLQSASVHLFNLFSSPPPGVWSKSHGEDIRKTFGPYPASVAMKTCVLVGEICSLSQNREDTSNGSGPDPTLNGESKEQEKILEEFGSKIATFQFSSNLLGGAKSSVTMETMESLSEDDDNDTEVVKSKITNDILHELSKSQKSHNVKQKKTKGPLAPPTASKYGIEWFQEQCKKCGSELPWQQLYNQLFELLVSESDETSLQVVVS